MIHQALAVFSVVVPRWLILGPLHKLISVPWVDKGASSLLLRGRSRTTLERRALEHAVRQRRCDVHGRPQDVVEALEALLVPSVEQARVGYDSRMSILVGVGVRGLGLRVSRALLGDDRGVER